MKGQSGDVFSRWGLGCSDGTLVLWQINESRTKGLCLVSLQRFCCSGDVARGLLVSAGRGRSVCGAGRSGLFGGRGVVARVSASAGTERRGVRDVLDAPEQGRLVGDVVQVATAVEERVVHGPAAGHP